MSKEDDFSNAEDYKWPDTAACVEMLNIEKTGLVNVLKNAIDVQNILMEISQLPSLMKSSDNFRTLEAITKAGYIVGALKYHVGDIEDNRLDIS